MKPSLLIRLSLLLFVVFSVRLLFLQLSTTYPVTADIDIRNGDLGYDGAEYLRYARNLAIHGTFSHSEKAPYVPSAFRTPLYPLFLAPFCRLCSTDHQLVLWITLAQIGLAGINALLTYWLAWRLTASSNLALAASAVASLDLYSILLNFQMMSETLFLTLFLVAVLLFLRYLVFARRLDLVGFSVVLAISGLCRPISLYALPIFLVALFMQKAEVRQRLTTVSVALLAFILIVAPWVARNWWKLNSIGVSTIHAYQEAIIAKGLERTKALASHAPVSPMIWDDLDALYTQCLDELREQTGKPVSFDSGIELLIAIDHPDLTPQLSSIVYKKVLPVIRQNRLLHFKESAKAALLTTVDTDGRVLSRILGENERPSGAKDLLKAVLTGRLHDAAALTKEVDWSRLVPFASWFGKIWTYGYYWPLVVFAVIGLLTALWKFRRREDYAAWCVVASLPLYLVCAPAYSASFGGELPRFRAPAVPFFCIFAVVGLKFLSESLYRYVKTKKLSGMLGNPTE